MFLEFCTQILRGSPQCISQGSLYGRKALSILRLFVSCISTRYSSDNPSSTSTKLPVYVVADAGWFCSKSAGSGFRFTMRAPGLGTTPAHGVVPPKRERLVRRSRPALCRPAESRLRRHGAWPPSRCKDDGCVKIVYFFPRPSSTLLLPSLVPPL